MKAFPKHYQNSDALQVKFCGWGQDSQKREIHLYMFAIWEKFPNNPVFLVLLYIQDARSYISGWDGPLL